MRIAHAATIPLVILGMPALVPIGNAPDGAPQFRVGFDARVRFAGRVVDDSGGAAPYPAVSRDAIGFSISEVSERRPLTTDALGRFAFVHVAQRSRRIWARMGAQPSLGIAAPAASNAFELYVTPGLNMHRGGTRRRPTLSGMLRTVDPRGDGQLFIERRDGARGYRYFKAVTPDRSGAWRTTLAHPPPGRFRATYAVLDKRQLIDVSSASLLLR